MSTPAEALKAKSAAPAVADDAPPKKSKKKLFMIIGIVVLLGGGFKAKSILLAPHYAAGQKVPDAAGATGVLPLDTLPPINLSDGHLIQVAISLQLSVAAAPAKMTLDLPRFDDAAITVFGQMTYNQLLAPAGKEQVRAKILAADQAIAGVADGHGQQINAVYFTGWTLQ